MKKLLFLGWGLVAALPLLAQQDTSFSRNLKEVQIRAWQRRDISRLPEEQNGFLNAGKKSEVINVSATNANISLKTARQIFSKVPGVFVYDMDGSGNQVNIATRGLDPHRSWEFNIRQNNIIINSDMYGYPASHYSPPMESYERIDLVRGTGSLQYGAQFGGMINYTTKKPDTAKAFSFETVNTAGSFKLLSTYNAISGTIKRFSYYAYYYRRHSDGYRKNSESDASSQLVQLQYRFSNKLEIKAELGRSKYLYHIPGPLTDSMFHAGPQMSTRSRNYFSPDIYVPSLVLNWKISSSTKINISASGVYGKRNSVQFDAFANVPDTIIAASGQYKNRQVDIDAFHSRTLEIRLLQQYKLARQPASLATGISYMNNDLHRMQLGKGTTASDYDLSLVEPGFTRDIHFRSNNIAVFAENIFHFGKKLTVSPGLRFESGDSRMSGTIKYYTVNALPTTITHRFLLAGISAQWVLDKENTIYAGMSQAYRPVIFKDIVPAAVYEQIDKNLKDAKGYNMEVGIRGKLFSRLQYDINYFRLLYQHRMGTLVLQDNSGQSYIYRTNVGSSFTDGAEIFLQYKIPVTSRLYIGLFTTSSYMNARYISGQVASGSTNISLKGNRVEAAPEWISRNGLELLYKGVSCTLLHNYTSSSYSDPLNTYTPPASGAKGYTPGYTLWDFNTSVRINSLLQVRAGVSNIFDKQYFSKRPVFYPGPGIWPGDGRNLNVTVGFKL